MTGRPITLEFSEPIQQYVVHFMETSVSIGIRRKGKDFEVASYVNFALSIHYADDDSPYNAFDLVSEHIATAGSISSRSRDAVQLALAGVGSISANERGFTFSSSPKPKVHILSIRPGEEAAEISLCFKEITVQDKSPPKALVLKVLPVDSEGGEVVAPLVSTPFYVVAYYLEIETKLEKPYIFFKDKGGKDSGINICVSCMRYDPQSRQSAIVQNRRVTVRPTLLYESGEVVADQNILKSINERENFTITNGKTWLKFRINEVSSHHLKQKFVLQMQQYVPSEHMISDIAPARSVGIDVRSKQNQRSVKNSASHSMHLQSQVGGSEGSLSDNESDLPVLKDRKRLHSSLDLGSTEASLAPSLRHPQATSILPSVLMPPPPPPPPPVPVPTAATSLISPAALEDFANACAVLKDFQGEAEKLVIMVENVHADHIPPNWFEKLQARGRTIDEKMKRVNESLVKLETLRLLIKTRAAGLPLMQAIPSSSLSITTTPHPLLQQQQEQQAVSLDTLPTSMSAFIPASTPIFAPQPPLAAPQPPSSSSGATKVTGWSPNIPISQPSTKTIHDLMDDRKKYNSNFTLSTSFGGTPSFNGGTSTTKRNDFVEDNSGIEFLLQASEQTKRNMDAEVEVETVLCVPVILEKEARDVKVDNLPWGFPAFGYGDERKLYLVGYYRLSGLMPCSTEERSWYQMELSRLKHNGSSSLIPLSIDNICPQLMEQILSPNAPERGLPVFYHFTRQRAATTIIAKRILRFFYSQGEHVKTATLEFTQDALHVKPPNNTARTLSDLYSDYAIDHAINLSNTPKQALSELQELVAVRLHAKSSRSLIVNRDGSVKEEPKSR